jgi:hypothetical protein
MADDRNDGALDGYASAVARTYVKPLMSRNVTAEG